MRNRPTQLPSPVPPNTSRTRVARATDELYPPRVLAGLVLLAGALLVSGCGMMMADKGGSATTRPASARMDKPGSPGIEVMNPTTRPDVRQLSQAWQAKADSFVTGAPLVDEQAGRVYFADWAGNAYAVSLADGSQVWKKQIAQVDMKVPWHGFTGKGALADGKLFLATAADGTAYALDPQNGNVLWQQKFVNDEQAGSIGELGYHNGMLFIGVASYEEPLTAMRPNFTPDFKGKVVALQASDGSLLWELPLAPDADGAGVWSGFDVDPQTNTLYFTTSNNYTKVNQLSDAIIAADARTGEIKWATQVVQNDRWTRADQIGPDYAFAAPPIVFDAGGRKLVGAGNKNGIFYACDAASGDVLWQTVVGYGGYGGGIHGKAVVEGDSIFVWSNNSYAYGEPAAKYPLDVTALDARTGDYQWMNATVQPASTTGGGVVAVDTFFTPCLDGVIRGYATANGKLTHAAQLPGSSPVSTAIVSTGNLLMSGSGLPKMFAPQPGNFRGVVAWQLPGSASRRQ